MGTGRVGAGWDGSVFRGWVGVTSEVCQLDHKKHSTTQIVKVDQVGVHVLELHPQLAI